MLVISWDLEREKKRRTQMVQKARDQRKRKGADRTDKDKDVKKKANSRRPRKSVSESYDQYSRHPPTKAQCAASGSSVWNAVATFYSSQPPPPERTMPYFDTLFSSPFLIRLLIAAVEKLDPVFSEPDNDFDYVET